jgi:hypothetical protein
MPFAAALPDIEVTVEELMNIDSLLMTDADRRLIAERVIALQSVTANDQLLP